jgi:hypothetical protein
MHLSIHRLILAATFTAAAVPIASADFRFDVAPAGTTDFDVDLAAVVPLTFDVDLFIVEDDRKNDDVELTDADLGLTGVVFTLSRVAGDAQLTGFEFADNFAASFFSEVAVDELTVEATGATLFGGSTAFGVEAGDERAVRLGTATIDLISATTDAEFTLANGITSQNGSGDTTLGNPLTSGRAIVPAAASGVAIPEPAALSLLGASVLLCRRR